MVIPALSNRIKNIGLVLGTGLGLALDESGLESLFLQCCKCSHFQKNMQLHLGLGYLLHHIILSLQFWELSVVGITCGETQTKQNVTVFPPIAPTNENKDLSACSPVSILEAIATPVGCAGSLTLLTNKHWQSLLAPSHKSSRSKILIGP